jgi:hypothetical protein
VKCEVVTHVFNISGSSGITHKKQRTGLLIFALSREKLGLDCSAFGKYSASLFTSNKKLPMDGALWYIRYYREFSLVSKFKDVDVND